MKKRRNRLVLCGGDNPGWYRRCAGDWHCGGMFRVAGLCKRLSNEVEVQHAIILSASPIIADGAIVAATDEKGTEVYSVFLLKRRFLPPRRTSFIRRLEEEEMCEIVGNKFILEVP